MHNSGDSFLNGDTAAQCFFSRISIIENHV